MTIGRPRENNKYNLTGEFGIGYTNKGEEFYFDLEDYDKIKDYCWSYHKGKRRYVESKSRDGSGKIVKIHRIIMNATNKKFVVDHINRNTLDNRKNNLRIVTDSENAKNRGESKINKTGVNGVSFREDNKKYRVRITVNRKEITIGHYIDFNDACVARMEAEKIFYGKYGRTDWNEIFKNILGK